MSYNPPVTGRVKSIKSKFENLQEIDSKRAVQLKQSTNQIVTFKRSSTSFDIFKRTDFLTNDNHKVSKFHATESIKEAINPIIRQSSDSFLYTVKEKLISKNFVKPLKEIKENEFSVGHRLMRHTSDPVKRGSIKRSPAFRIGDKQNKTVLTKIEPIVPKEFNDKSEIVPVLKPQEFGLTDTLKAALKQPLPAGPPPKKPPRLFDLSKDDIQPVLLTDITVDKPTQAKQEDNNSINFLGKQLNDNQNTRIIARRELQSSNNQNLLNCFLCASPIYDSDSTQNVSIVNCSFTNNDSTEYEPIEAPQDITKAVTSKEHIYMEPFEHLKNNSWKLLDAPTTMEHSLNKNKDENGKANCTCPSEHHTKNGDVHYLCTSINDSFNSESEGRSTMDSPTSITNTYDEINILVNAAFDHKARDSGLYSLDTTPDKEFPPPLFNPIGHKSQNAKLSRSLTEKRKNYVRRVSAIPDVAITTGTYGTLHRPSYQLPILKTFFLDNSTAPVEQSVTDSTFVVESTSERINKYNKLLEANNPTNRKKIDEDLNDSNINSDSERNQNDCSLEAASETTVKLFQMCIIAGYNVTTKSAYIKTKYPDDIAAPPNIEQLIFPSESLIQQGKDNQEYSLILTDIDGFRLYGYCRRVLPESSEICLPLAYCLLSEIKAPGFFFKILREIEHRHGQTDFQTNYLLTNLQKTPLPSAGKFLHLKLPVSPVRSKTVFMSNHRISTKRLSLDVNPKWLQDSIVPTNIQQDDKSDRSVTKKGLKSLVEEFEDKKHDKPPYDFSLINRNLMSSQHGSRSDEILIKRPNDLRLESTELSDLHEGLGAELLITVFGSLLLERKVILFSQNIARLTSCVLGLQTILYPFQWQYTVVTVLPKNLVEICQAPFPVLAGMLKNVHFDIEDGIVVDLDGKLLKQKCDDEVSILPDKLRESLLVSLQMVDLLDQGKMLSSVLIAEAFLRFFVELFAGYKGREYEKDAFIQSHPSPTVRLFLEWFVETAMFRNFVNVRYSETSKESNRIESFALFDARLFEKSENKAKINNNIETIMKNCRIINRKAKSIKDRLKDFITHN